MAKGICTVDGCARAVRARELCDMHYQRKRATGSVHLARQPTTLERFWAKVDKTASVPTDNPELGSCWLWTAHIMWTGYGQFCYTADRRAVKGVAHRYSYTITVGPIPDGLHLDHLCRVRACVRPDHLEAVTQKENNRRAAEYRWARAATRLPTIPADRLAMAKAATTMSDAALAEFGISRTKHRRVVYFGERDGFNSSRLALPACSRPV